MKASDFLTSFVAGLVAATVIGGFTWVVRAVWLAHVSPWWENHIYKDARVDGVWETTLTTQREANYHERATVNQVGHAVNGTLECVSGVDKGNTYEFKGVIRNGILSAYYWNTRKSALDSGSFTLRLEENGDRLAGHTVYYFDKNHTLVSREYCWARIIQLKDPDNCDEGSCQIEQEAVSTVWAMSDSERLRE